MKLRINKEKGFTLIEIMVSVSIFAVIMLIASGSIYSVFDANKKSQSLRGVMDNLNFSLESMTRSIRFGSAYHCDISQGTVSQPRDCSTAANSISVTDSNGAQVAYRLSNGRIARTINSGTDTYITSSDVVIDNLRFFVYGSAPYSSRANINQPRVIVQVIGHAGSGPKTTIQSSFTLQTMISQRLFDSQ